MKFRRSEPEIIPHSSYVPPSPGPLLDLASSYQQEASHWEEKWAEMADNRDEAMSALYDLVWNVRGLVEQNTSQQAKAALQRGLSLLAVTRWSWMGERPRVEDNLQLEGENVRLRRALKDILGVSDAPD